MKMKVILAGVVMLFGLTAGAAQAAYPEKPITLICWSSAGSSHDLMARVVAKLAEEILGQAVVVVNKEGGGGR